MKFDDIMKTLCVCGCMFGSMCNDARGMKEHLGELNVPVDTISYSVDFRKIHSVGVNKIKSDTLFLIDALLGGSNIPTSSHPFRDILKRVTCNVSCLVALCRHKFLSLRSEECSKIVLYLDKYSGYTDNVWLLSTLSGDGDWLIQKYYGQCKITDLQGKKDSFSKFLRDIDVHSKEDKWRVEYMAAAYSLRRYVPYSELEPEASKEIQSIASQIWDYFMRKSASE